MEDNLLEYLGEWFVKDELYERHGWAFEYFVQMYNAGLLENLIKLNNLKNLK